MRRPQGRGHWRERGNLLTGYSSLPDEVRERIERDFASAPRQLEVLKLHLGGRTMRQIALALGIAPSTVTSHLWRAKQKLSSDVGETEVAA